MVRLTRFCDEDALADPDSKTSIRFYFSFRSPYAWLATERLEEELGDLGVPIERIPTYPTPELFPNDPRKRAATG